MYYSSIGVLALILHLIINLDYIKPYSKAAIARMPVTMRRYRFFLFSLAVFYLTDILWGAFYALELIPITYLDTIMFFIAMATTVLFWTRYVTSYLGRQGAWTTLFVGAGWMIFLFQTIALFINAFIPIFFEFDSNGGYHTYTGRMVTLVLQLLLYFFTSIYALKVVATSDGKTRLHHRTIAFSGIVMALFIAMQCQFPLMPFYTVGCLIATCLVHTFVTSDEKVETRKLIGETRLIAYRDALTGARSVHAYVETRENIDRKINADKLTDLAVVVFDLNGLKTVNDNLGHEEGDKYICTGYALIKEMFNSCPVYRIGGDEFVAMLEGDDFNARKTMMEAFNRRMDKNKEEGRITISAGLDEYVRGQDNDFNAIFERADRKMYERKKQMKAEF